MKNADKIRKHLILFDGACGLCRRSVAWVQRKDIRKQFRALPYQQTPAPPMTPELYAACVHAVHVLTTDGQTLRAGRAVLFILERVGWGRVAHLLSLPPLVWGVELGYSIVANNRDFFARFLFTQEADPDL